jgi:hypothetical protein
MDPLAFSLAFGYLPRGKGGRNLPGFPFKARPTVTGCYVAAGRPEGAIDVNVPISLSRARHQS